MKRIISLLCGLALCVSALGAKDVDDPNHLQLHAKVNEAFYKAFVYPEIKDPNSTESKINKALDKVLNYPSNDSLRYEGRIVLRFSVYQLGRISHVSVVKGLCPEIDKAAVKALNSQRSKMRFSSQYRNKVYIQAFYISKDGCNQTVLTADEPVYALPDTPSVPAGGEAALMQFLAEELQYPHDALREQLQGRVLVQFTLDKQGDVAFGYIEASDDAGTLDFEAARLVANIPQMTPARHQGDAVRCAWLVPVVFRLTSK